MALKSLLGDIWELSPVAETAVQCFCVPADPDWGGAPLALQHVVVALVVVVISVVIEIRTVIGSRYQREGPVVVFRVQWLLLNADVMPGGREESKNAASLLPYFFFITFEHTQADLRWFCL